VVLSTQTAKHRAMRLAAKLGGGADARVTSITLTEQGQAAATEVTAARGAVLEKALLAITDDQQRHLEQLLEGLLAEWPRTLDHSCQMCRLCDLSACPAGRCPVEQRYQQFAGQDSHAP
jgi:hypothetical protein